MTYDTSTQTAEAIAEAIGNFCDALPANDAEHIRPHVTLLYALLNVAVLRTPPVCTYCQRPAVVSWEGLEDVKCQACGDTIAKAEGLPYHPEPDVTDWACADWRACLERVIARHRQGSDAVRVKALDRGTSAVGQLVWGATRRTKGGDTT
jgi:ribosomal protein L37AE/L43A